MKSDSRNQPIRALEQVLDLERKALIEGKLTSLNRFAADKEQLIETLRDAADVDIRQLARVQDQITRNQVLLRSALDGISTVAKRMAELRKVARGFETYDQTGHKSHHAIRRDATLEKRA